MTTMIETVMEATQAAPASLSDAELLRLRAESAATATAAELARKALDAEIVARLTASGDACLTAGGRVARLVERDDIRSTLDAVQQAREVLGITWSEMALRLLTAGWLPSAKALDSLDPARAPLWAPHYENKVVRYVKVT